MGKGCKDGNGIQKKQRLKAQEFQERVFSIMIEDMARNTQESITELENAEKIYAIWLSNALMPGSIHVKPLLEKYGSFKEVYGLGKEQYAQLGIGEGTDIMKRLCNKDLGESEKILGFCGHYNFGVLIYTSEFYPKRLKLIKDPPPVLYVRGRWIDTDSNVCIAVVGTRNYSEIGWKSTYMITEGLAKCGAVVVTGLASGIDTAAASASLAASGMTIGVLGTGIERIYPSENASLFNEMYSRGMLISELPPYASTSPSYFPVRNRIISGLCHGVLVGEGATKSGAMITAAHASEQGRHIFAIPGDISSPESSGVNSLINEGATPVFDAWTVLEKYYYAYPHRIKKLQHANGSFVPEARSKRRIRVEKGKKSSSVYESELSKDTPERPKKKSVFGFGKRKDKNEAGELSTADILQNPTVQNGNSEASSPSMPLEILSDNERKIYDVLSESDFMNMDTISMRTQLDIREVMECVTNLEISGFAISGAGGTKRIGTK